ncbi:MAG: hypothetical protein M1827_004157 [Pycnora praestabilis]|nr:MAG: hypothetical protein M1827_004157 [Pycnora praestabilis]
MAAPLPSPAANQPSQPTQYFNSAYSQTSKQLPAQRQIAQQTVQYPPQGHPEAQGQSLFDSAQQPPPYDYSQARGGMNDPTASSPFIRDFNLVAEAAKRAQMAVLMRDMEGVAL